MLRSPQFFWQIIDKSHDFDPEVMYENIQHHLSDLSAKDVALFECYLECYLHNLSDCIWIDMACKVINHHVSEDNVLYFSLWLIAQGENTVLNALKDPDSLAKLRHIPFGYAKFELLLSATEIPDLGEIFDEMVVHNQMELMLNQEDLLSEDECIECLNAVNETLEYKDGKRNGSYVNFDDAMKDIPQILPHLVQRAAEEKDCE